MNNKELISSVLLEIAKRSETVFLADDEVNQDLIDAAGKMGIVIPSPDLLLMKTVYAEIDRVNLNGVVLPRKAVEEGLPTLIAKQCNWEHDGSGRICGFTLAVKINGNEIETINVIFKSLFPDETADLKAKIKSKEAAVSFEIWNRDPVTGNSVVSVLSDGNVEINPIIFHGTGVLLVNPPACPKALIFKMIGKCEAIDSKKIEDKSFTEDLVYAQLAVEEPKCNNCKTCTCDTKKEVLIVEEIKAEVKTEEILDADYDGGEIDEAKKLTTEQRNALPDSDFALIQTDAKGNKIRRFPINDEAHVRNALARLPQAKGLSPEEKASTLAKILKKAKELNMTELLKKYAAVEEVVEASRLCKTCSAPIHADNQSGLCADCVAGKSRIPTSPDVKQTPEYKKLSDEMEKLDILIKQTTDPVELKKLQEERKLLEQKELKLFKAEEIIPEIKVEETKVEAEVKLEEVEKTTPEETKVEAEVKPEVVEEVVKEEANVITKTEEEVKVIETSPTLDVVTTVKKTTEVNVDESGKVLNTIVEEIKTVETFSFEQVTEQVASAKVELQKIVEAQLLEIEKLKQELEVAKQPKEIVKASEEDTTPADLTVGEVNTTGEDALSKRAKEIDSIITEKNKKR